MLKVIIVGLLSVSGALLVYAASLLFFGLVACFSNKHRKHAMKVLALLVRVQMRSG